MSLINFGSSAHWYSPVGTPQHDADLRVARKSKLYPSVTTILKDTFKNDFLDRWKMNELAKAACENPIQPHENHQQYAQRLYELSMEKARKAANFGKEIHHACEVYPQTPVDQSIMPWFLRYEEWHKAVVDSVVWNERVLVDHDTGIAGRGDIKVILKTGDAAIVDIKTQDVKMDDKGRKKPAFYDDWPRQLAQYAVSDAKNGEAGGFPTLPLCISVILDSNPDGLLYAKTWSCDEILLAYEEFVHGAWLWFNKRDYWPIGKWHTPDFPIIPCDETKTIAYPRQPEAAF